MFESQNALEISSINMAVQFITNLTSPEISRFSCRELYQLIRDNPQYSILIFLTKQLRKMGMDPSGLKLIFQINTKSILARVA